jgi:hypothetical protein
VTTTSFSLRAAAASRRATVVFHALLAIIAASAVAQPLKGQTLGHKPLCEASAVAVIDCPDGAGRCLLVGDNEVRTSLFLFNILTHGIDSADPQPLPLTVGEDTELSDIEALARLDQGGVVVFASHGRNAECEAKDNRRRFGIIGKPGVAQTAIKVTESGVIGCAALFGDPAPTNPLVRAACAEIDRAEAAADAVAKDRERCKQVNAFNAEGAVNVAAGAAPDLWIGLRSPLLSAHPTLTSRRDLAMLMHLKGLDAYAFDRVTVLDLGGRGIRDLAFADGWVWVIAGPPEDQKGGTAEPFQLRRFRADALDADAIIESELVRDDLPSSAEGLAIFDGQALVVIDGDKGDKKAKDCAVPAGFVILPLAGSTLD